MWFHRDLFVPIYPQPTNEPVDEKPAAAEETNPGRDVDIQFG